MELGYLRRLHLGTAGRVSFGERGRPAVRLEDDREALERIANVLDDLSQVPHLSGHARRVLAAIAQELMQAGY